MDEESSDVEVQAEAPQAEATPSLADTLSEAFDAQTEIEEETLDEGVEEEESDLEEVEEDELEDLEIAAESEEEEADPIEAPEHWSADDRELFNAQPQEAKEFLLRRHKEMEAAANQKFEEAASARKVQEQLDQIVTPEVKQAWAMQGLNEWQGIQQMIAYARGLQTDPQAVLQQVAQMYGVDLTAQTQSETTDEYVDPQVKALQDRINQLESQTSQRDQSDQQRQLQEANQQIQSFKEERGEDGNLLRPHFDQLNDDMVVIANGMRAKGEVPNLETVYQRALSWHPELTQVKEPEVKGPSKEEKAKKARRARSAAAGARSSVAQSGKAEPTTMREALEAEVSKHF